jgi:tungstate transport system substrate-binding protein
MAMAQGSMISKRRVLERIAPLMTLVLVAAACSSAASPSPQVSAPAASAAPASVAPASAAAGTPDLNSAFILATTTSTQDSGLLDVLVPAFELATGYVVKTVAVGSGQAMTMGRECNADVLLVHSPAAETEFMDAGSGVDRRLVMHNDFVIVGPASDPAGIKGTAKAADALAGIAAAEATFVSRADKSGTNSKELALWKAADITPTGAWYLESGQGMGATLQIASEKGGYTLTDRATYLALKDKLNLDILVEGEAGLLNVYHVISVNPAKCPGVNTAGATAFADYLVSADGQALIGEFGTQKFGQPLFVPDAGKSEDSLGS